MTPEDLRGPRTPRLPGESVDAYVSRIFEAIGWRGPKSSEYMPFEFVIYQDEAFPEVAMPPEPGIFREPT